MYSRILLFILVGFSVGSVLAQQRLSVVASTMSSPGQNPGIGNVYYANRNEPPRAIEFKERTVTASYFLANINHYFNLPNEFTFIEAESNTDNLGMRHRLLQQYYKGIMLEGMAYRMHEKDGFMRSVNGKAVRNINVDTHTLLSEEHASYKAVEYLHTKDTIFRQARKLVVSKDFTFTPESFFIAFQFDIDVSLIEQWRISINAHNGQVINKVSLVNTCLIENKPTQPLTDTTGTGLTNYYGSQTIRVEKFENGSSRMVGQTEHGGSIGTYDFNNASLFAWIFGLDVPVYNFYSPDNTYNNPYYKPAVSVQWAAEQAYEYYFKKHSRNSFDNNGSAITSYVHVDQNLNNAFWARNILLFGDGSNNNPLVELDVVGHELTHGVTQHEANLQYYYESGALNESFSDIFGKAVEFSVFGDTATWQMSKHYRDGGLRDFSNPNLKNQPDTYAGDLWYAGYEDNGGVHYNSGVQNFWFYLLCEGGTGVNDQELSYSVNAIGMDAATKIAYRNLTEYLSTTSDYLDSRIGSLLATADLYGKNSTVYQEVDKAWDAVGVVDEPIITSLELYDTTATTVKIKGSLLPRGDTVTYHFEYGTTPALGSSSSTYKYTDKVEGVLTGLQSQTKYYLRLVATNENGSSYATTEFITISLAPLVKIKQTVDVTETTAILYGQINPNSLLTSFYFEYGLTPALGLVTQSYSAVDTTEFLNVSAPIINLQSRQTYYYKLVATNSFASSATELASFFTAVKPIVSSFAPATAAIGTEVVITGQNFNSLPENNVVSFGATRANVLSSSSTEIKVTVPMGASFGQLTLLDRQSGLAAESVQEFIPTFTGEFKKGDLQLTVGIKEPYIWGTSVHDIDGDNKPDIVSIHYQGFSIFQNVNQGGDITAESFVRNTFNVPEFDGSSYFQVIDVDGNGLKDIVGRTGNGVRIYPNLSVPGYIFFGPPVDLPIGYLRELILRDFDQDGRTDVAGIRYVNSDSSLFTIFRNQNAKGYLSAKNFEQKYSKILPYYMYFMTSGDLNNDGKIDLVTGALFEDFLLIQKNNSYPGVFEFEEYIVPDSTRGRFTRYISHDFNLDGRLDVASHSPYENGNLALMENASTSASIALSAPIIELSENTQSNIQVGDINGDGKVDLLAGLSNRRFIFLENKAEVSEHLSDSSFKKFEEYGMPLVNAGSGTVESQMIINDLNGDGRPEVINAYSYRFYPHDGYQMEIWQNAPANCLDPSLITLNVSNYTATIVLPPNTTLDQYEIEYTISGYNYWDLVSSTTLYLSSGRSYQLRVRAKCGLSFTEYFNIDFTTDCVNTDYFSISSIGTTTVTFNLPNYYYEVQYSPTGKDEWLILPLYSSQITNLLPGATYDLRIRGNCSIPAQFKYRQFTTLCSQLSSLFITNLSYNKAEVNWLNSDAATIVEYSADNVNWILIDETLTMSNLTPGKQYFVRGQLVCANINSDFVYTSFTTPCPKVSALQIISVTPFNAMINWVDVSNTGSYTVTYSLTLGGAATTVETSSTSFNIEGLRPGAEYIVGVAPNCIGTKEFTTTVFSTVCYVPFNLSTDSITYTTAELSWSDNFSGLPYSIDYSISGSNVWMTKETPLTTISLAELRPSTKYEARVHINCISEMARYVSVLFETDHYGETTIAPNPTDNIITINPSKDLIGSRFSIYDNTGKKVADAELRDYIIDFTDFSPGMYTLKIEGEKPVKIIKY